MTATYQGPPAGHRAAGRAGGSGAPGPGGARTRHAAARPQREPTAARRTLLALLASACAAMPLKGLITDYGWLIDVWLTMLIVVGPAALLRTRRPPGALDVWPGVVLAIPWLTLRFVPDHAFAGFIPTTGTWHDLGALMDDLHHTTNSEVAPVHSTVAIKLVLCALLGLLAALIDLIAIVGRRGALAGVPLLVVYTVSGAVPRHPVSWVWFAFAAAGFLLLLAVNADDELTRWGRRIGRPGGRGGVPLAVPVSAPRIAVVAVIVAIIVPLVVPEQSRNLISDAFHQHGGGSGGGFGSGSGISPFVNLKGELDRTRPATVLSVTLRGTDAQRPPFYLRSEVLDQYTGPGWRRSDHGDTQGLGSDYPTDPPTVAPQSRSYDADISIKNLGGNAPLFAVPTFLDGLRDGTRWNPRDELLLGKGVQGGDTYHEQFTEATPSAADLRGAVGDIPADMSRWLKLPSIPQKVKALVARLTSNQHTPYDKARAITDFFAQPSSGFQYSLKTKTGDSSNDLVNFLDTRIGFCQQYAAATAVMFRLAGVPSRVVLGYMHPVANANGGFTVTSFDAHAWVEAYFKGIGWVPFDTTPIDGLDGGSKSDLGYAPHNYQSNGNDGVTKSRTDSGTSSAAAPSSGAGTTSSTHRAAAAPADRTPLWVALGVLAVVLLALAPAAARLLRRRRRIAAARFGDPDPLWAELSDTAVDLGYVWSPARSPRQVAAWLGRDTQDKQALDALAHAVEHHRFGPAVGESDTADLGRGLGRVTKQLRARRSSSVRLRARLWPASLGWSAFARGGVRMGGRRRR